MSDFITMIKGHTLEFYEDDHIYLADGVMIPSITQILKLRFADKYRNVSESVLKKASAAGVKVHSAIEDFCKNGKESNLPELRGFKFLRRAFGFQVIDNEVPVLLLLNGEPFAAGRIDLFLEDSGKFGIGDIKRTSQLDKDYLFYQLNLYRLAFTCSYDTDISFLKALWLRGDNRKYIDIPVNVSFAFQLIDEYRKAVENEQTDFEAETA